MGNGYHCIFSMQKHTIFALNSQMYAYFKYNSSNKIYTLNIPSTTNYNIAHTFTCVLQCPPTYFYNNYINNYTCLRCIDYVKYCLNCINEKTCINCISTDTLSSDNFTCIPCTQIHSLCLTCLN